MNLIVDTLGAPGQSGGMRLYAQELIHAWAEQFGGDRLLVVGGDWVRSEFQRWNSVETVTVPNESTAARVLGQFLLVAYLFNRSRSDFLLSTSPIVSPLVPRSRRMCVVHDWRHVKNGHEFGLPQRWYRKLWQTSVNGACVAVAISRKTAEETGRLVPSANVRVVEDGCDHSSRWPVTTRQEGQSSILTFGHHSNKRPDLVIRALALLKGTIPADTQLLVLGTRGKYERELKDIALNHGVEQQCRFPGFVEEHEYRNLIQRANVIILASSDEGFGLPVTEAQHFGIPLICTSDSGLTSIHGSDLLVADPTPESIAERILDGFQAGVSVSNRRPPKNTWAEVAREMRSIIVENLDRDLGLSVIPASPSDP